MKRFLFFAASAALALASCSEQVDFTQESLQKQNEGPTPVQFGTYLGKTGTTRAVASGGSKGDITTTVLKGEDYGFGVIAYHTDANNWAGNSNTTIPNFMWNEWVIYNSTNSSWTYSPVKFWPNDFANAPAVDNKEGEDESKVATGSKAGGKVSFFAYAPYVPVTTTAASYKNKTASQESTPATTGITAVTANTQEAEPQVYYVLGAADVENAVDLLWGLRGNSSGYQLASGDGTTANTDAASVGDYNVNLTKQSVSEKVNFLFKHALAKVGGHTPSTDPAGLQTGLQVVLDIDNGSFDGGVKEGSAITGGAKEKETLVTVNSIEIYDQKSATDASVTSSSETSNLVKEGWFNIATGKWDLTTGESTVQTGATYSTKVKTTTATGYTGILNADIAEPSDLTKLSYNTTFTSYPWKNDATEMPGVTITPQDVYTETSDVPSLLLIPSNTDQTLVIKIKYTVRTYDTQLATSANNDNATNGTWTKVEQTITNEVTIPAGSLQSNKYYKLLIHLGLTSVKFTASVVDWEEAAGSTTHGTDNENGNNDKDIYLPSNTLGTTTVASTETVSSATVAAGSSKMYSVPAGATTFTVNLTGIANTTSTVTAVATGADASVTPTVTYTANAETGTVSIGLTANNSDSETRTTTLTITTKDSSSNDVTTVVTLVQVPASE